MPSLKSFVPSMRRKQKQKSKKDPGQDLPTVVADQVEISAARNGDINGSTIAGTRHLPTSQPAATLGAEIGISLDTKSVDNPPRQSRRRNSGIGDLRDKLSQPQSMGIPLQQDCFPQDLLRKIITKDAVDKALRVAPNDLAAFALSATKIFAIILLMFRDEAAVIDTLSSFMHHGFGNESLPIVDMGNSCENGYENCELGCSIDATSKCSHHDSKLNLFHHHPWDAALRKEFYNHQWKFLIPVFRLSPEDGPQECSLKEILPITKHDGSDIKGAGYFGEVFQGQILTKYQTEVKDDKEWLKIAIKQLKYRNDMVIEKEWKQEIDAFAKFNKLNHDHITRAIAACRQDDRYYIFLEWASGDNLRKLWSRNPKPVLDDRNIKEFLYQLYGLVDALYHMHEDSDVLEDSTPAVSRPGSFYNADLPSELNSSLGPGESSPSMTHFNGPNLPQIVASTATSNASRRSVGNTIPDVPQLVVDEATSDGSMPKSNWRHGDIKPENILVFQDDSSWLGTLKLGDLGRAKKHQFVTEAPQRRATGEIYGTKQYEPPEAFLSAKKARSRKYDIWSMGCIIFEAVYWLLYGIEDQRTIKSKTTAETPHGTRYWVPDPDCRDEPKAKVNPVTEDAINKILKDDPACNVESGTALRDLLLLVRDHLLVVHLSVPANLFQSSLKKRSTAVVMREVMNTIMERVERDSKYLFVEHDRTSVKAPVIYEPVTSESDTAAAPNTSAPSRKLGLPRTPMKQVDSYAHGGRDIWEFADDDKFTKSVIANGNIDLQYLQPQIDSTICSSCKNRDFQDFPLPLSKLKIQYVF